MQAFRELILLCTLALVFSCKPTPRPVVDPMASQCEVVHDLQGSDELLSRIQRMPDGWLVSLRMKVQIDPRSGPVTVRGLGRVYQVHGQSRCEVIEADGIPGTPRFDEALCLDEIEWVANLLDGAEHSAHPGETVVQEVALRVRPHRGHSRLTPAQSFAFEERAEIRRDRDGRVAQISRTSPGDAREQIHVEYPAGVHGRCLPPHTETQHNRHKVSFLARVPVKPVLPSAPQPSQSPRHRGGRGARS